MSKIVLTHLPTFYLMLHNAMTIIWKIYHLCRRFEDGHIMDNLDNVQSQRLKQITGIIIHMS